MNTSSIFMLNTNGNNFGDMPRDIYIDTCFWNEIYGLNTTYGTYCKQFLRECAVNNITLYRSPLVKEEISHVIKNSTIKDFVKQNNIVAPKYKNGQINNKALFESVIQLDPNIVQTIRDEVYRVHTIIDSLTEHLPYEHDEEFQDSINNMTYKYDYRIGTADVKHILIPHMYGINNIATVDIDFAYAENLNVFVPPTYAYSQEVKNRTNTMLAYDENKF
jgi:predicted nucleic acid-binding protein